jgi:AcrR family transcriptional regulator
MATTSARKQQGEKTKAAILESAIELYADAGVRGTGLMAIGERAGVHHATVLYHFGSSKDLLFAVLAERDRRFAEYSAEAFGSGGLDAITNLPVVARFNVENASLAKLFTVLQVENFSPDAEAHDYFVDRRREVRRRLVRSLARAHDAGEIRADADIAAVAETVLSFTAGSMVQYVLSDMTIDLVAVYETFTAALLTDLAGADRRTR